MHYYQFNIGDYKTHTGHLTPIEDICYRRLLDHYYLHEEPLENNIDKLTRLLMLNGYSTDVEQVLNEFFILIENRWYNNRADAEITAFQLLKDSKSKAGKASAAKRLSKSQQVLNTRLTDEQLNKNYKPLTINNDKSIVINDVADCPHQEIISLYKKILPMGTIPLTWDGSRSSQLKARWREQAKRQNLDWWEGLFKYIAQSEFLTGQVNSDKRKPFVISLDWIIKSENFKKITEGKYHG